MPIFVPTILTYPDGALLMPEKQLLLEVGPGRGDFLFHLARENPRSQVVGIEIKQKRFEKMKPRIEKRGLQNILLFCGDARFVLPQKFPDNSVEQLYILFSDPWPKKRHAKHRIFQKSFIQELLRVMKPSSAVFVAHDDPTYQQQIREEFSQFPEWEFSPTGIDFQTFYAEKWQKEGRNLNSFSYKKIVESTPLKA